jgi:hypothetical protein
LHTHRQVALGGAEHDAVEVIDRGAVDAAGFDDAVHRRDKVVQRVEAQMVERHERFDRFQLDLQPHRITKRAIRIGEGLK